MVERLRAEDVKEAIIEAEDDVTYQAEVLASEPPWPTVLAAARLWLASQEQTPDYRAAKLAAMEMDEQIAMARSQGQRFSLTEVNNMKVKAAVDAALVGFHPQNEGDER